MTRDLLNFELLLGTILGTSFARNSRLRSCLSNKHPQRLPAATCSGPWKNEAVYATFHLTWVHEGKLKVWEGPDFTDWDPMANSLKPNSIEFYSKNIYLALGDEIWGIGVIPVPLQRMVDEWIGGGVWLNPWSSVTGTHAYGEEPNYCERAGRAAGMLQAHDWSETCDSCKTSLLSSLDESVWKTRRYTSRWMRIVQIASCFDFIDIKRVKKFLIARRLQC